MQRPPEHPDGPAEAEGVAEGGRVSTKFYYVDEAGDPTLFNRRGQVIVGGDGCSRFFMLGKLDVADPDGLGKPLQDLRRALLDDPYFRGVPSMSADRRKTARLLHAKDDVPEVRREVLNVLAGAQVRFYAVVRDKRVIAEKVLARNQTSNYRYRPNDLYDSCVPRLFENRLHKDQAYRIVFARRGSSDRTEAFDRGLHKARERLRLKWGIESAAPIEIVPANPQAVTCLQATDYFLWATQRCFERAEHRYLDLLWDKVGLVIDWDDRRRNMAGEYYTRKRVIPEGFRT